MSSTATRVPLEQAQHVANELFEVLGAGCVRLAIAGSIRRGRADVGDIELVAVPRVHQESVTEGLFETTEITVNELDVCIDLAMMDGTLIAHPDDPKRGPKYSKLVHAASGLQVDLFSAKPDGSNFGLQMLIRTGPADYSHRFVTVIRGRGFHVAGGAELHHGRGSADPQGIWHPPVGCPTTCIVEPTPDEDLVYAAVGLSWLDPEDRA